MNAFEFDDVNQMYEYMVRLLLEQKSDHGTKELTNVFLTINDVSEHIITKRDISLSYLCGELLWYFSGSNDTEFISKFAKKWLEISDDGSTSNSAYGYILGTKHGFNQLQKIFELLKKDKHSRRAVINFNIPNANVIETKDEICTIAVQFIIRNNKLHCTTMMRSNDIYTGMPYDIAFFVSLQKIMAFNLGVECGKYNHFVTSLHLYERTEEKIKSALDKKSPKIKFDALNLMKLGVDDYDYIMNSKSPKDDVINMFTKLKILEVET